MPVFARPSEDFRPYSFQPNPYQTIGADEGELEVWVNRPRQYVDLLQQMTDETFTPETGIRVKFSLMPDPAKLVPQRRPVSSRMWPWARRRPLRTGRAQRAEKLLRARSTTSIRISASTRPARC